MAKAEASQARSSYMSVFLGAVACSRCCTERTDSNSLSNAFMNGKITNMNEKASHQLLRWQISYSFLGRK